MVELTIVNRTGYPLASWGAPQSEALIRVRQGSASAGDVKLVSAGLEELRGRGLWLRCECRRLGRGSAPLMTPVHRVAAGRIHLRRMTGEGRGSHDDACPLAGETEVSVPSGRQGAGVSKIPAADLLRAIVAKAGLSRAAAEATPLGEVMARVRSAGRMNGFGGGGTGAVRIATHPRALEGFAVGPDAEGGWLCLFAREIEGRTIEAAGGQLVKIADRPQVLGEAGGPYLAVSRVDVSGDAPVVGATTAVPVVSGRWLIPILSAADRDLFWWLLRLRRWLMRDGLALEIESNWLGLGGFSVTTAGVEAEVLVRLAREEAGLAGKGKLIDFGKGAAREFVVTKAQLADRATGSKFRRVCFGVLGASQS